MRYSRLFNQTLRTSPAQSEAASHQYLTQAGYLRPLASGIFAYLPLAQRTLRNIASIIREEMEAIGGQEVSLPIVHPAEIWQQTGRWYTITAEMGRFKDRNGHDMVLAMTHEEAVAAIVHDVIQSYRQLPALIYQIQLKWRDDPRPRAGLIRAREFTMLDSYSLDRDEEGLEVQYQAHYNTYHRIFERCELPVIAIQSDSGMMGGVQAHEFMYLNPIGEDTIMLCSSCSYAANRQVATFQKDHNSSEDLKEVEKIVTPEKKTIADLVEFLQISPKRTAKAVFLMAEMHGTEKLVLALVRGDMELNEAKLAHAIQASGLRPATEEDILLSGAVPGYASPIGIKNTLVVVDDQIPHLRNLTVGANQSGYHLKNVNFGRDYQTDIIADIVSAEEGFLCPQCGHPLSSQRGVEVGNIFKLGTFYSEQMECQYLDENGASKPIVMGSYGIGLGRLMACIAEEHHDENGLCWPLQVAPYNIHMLSIKDKDGAVQPTAEDLYEQLLAAGISVLYDDRDISAGVKFNDADLLGMPYRITISARALSNGGIEIKSRSNETSHILPREQVLPYLQKIASRH
ncbi:MAG TPA: proline--tRNA ligase [Anaerolineaceae bacterium]|uniref:Proline--tRNA ligase n=1 Tax=Anaerolinea thermophila TaxID=167964 RepID=A0A117LH48_9CHLR|nr:MAG: proS [Anaerolinea thermophila]HAF61709.1 proline--tRNA ligase [Anaerolineaceae bacterium]